MNKPSVAPLLAALAATIPDDRPTTTEYLPFYNTGGVGYPFGISKGGTKKKYGPSVLDQILAVTTQEELNTVTQTVVSASDVSDKTLKLWMKALGLKQMELRNSKQL